jgi:hypothetical protein
MKAIELAGMVIEDEETSAQRGDTEGDGVGSEQQDGKKRAAHACR